jgi:ferric-dicitrate binding protein FerR (iron transport regulator)
MLGNTTRGGSVADEAAEWLATLTDSACTNEERQRFVEWLKRSNLHVDEFLRLSALTKQLTRSELWPQQNLQDLIAQAVSTHKVITTLPGSTGKSGPARAALPSRFGWALQRSSWPGTYI